jgi:hypothetical protein
MRKTILAAAALAALGCVSAAAQSTPTESAPRACLRFGEIYSWNAPDNYTLIVEDNLHKKFKVRLMSYCPNVTFKERVGFRSPGSMDLSCMSPGDDVLVNQFGAGPQRCPISSITAYTPAMEMADKAAAAAKAQGHY